MTKIATVTPINCITHEQDGDPFELIFDANEGRIIGRFDDGREETLEFGAKTLLEAIDVAYALYACSTAYIYEQEEVDVE